MPHGRVKIARKSTGGVKGRRAKKGGKRTGSRAGAIGWQGASRPAVSSGHSSKRRVGNKVTAAGKARPRRRASTGKSATAAGKAKARPRRRAATGKAPPAASKARPRRRAAASAAKPRQRHTTGHGKRATESLRAEILQYYDAGGFLSWSAAAKKFVILGTNEPKGGLVPCPECGLGQLMVVRSKATRKRFIGCSNYYGGCDASSPLLQKARLRALKQACPACAWPMVIFRYTRNQKWTRQCSNVRCPTRAAPPPG